MAFRFGRSHWQDSDRLNLIEVCQKHQQWDQRLAAMKEIYAKANYPQGYFTENTCREELERILNQPVPNHHVNVSEHFSYSRKILMEKWATHFRDEIKKARNAQVELSVVSIRSNTAKIKELFENPTEERIQELYEEAQRIAESKKNDPAYARIVGTFRAAMDDRLKKCNGKIDVSGLDLPPPTKPTNEETDHTTKGFLSPACDTTASRPEVIFSPSVYTPMLSIAEAVKQAVPVPEPEPEPEPEQKVEEEPMEVEVEEPEPVKIEEPAVAPQAPPMEETPEKVLEPVASPVKQIPEKSKEKTVLPQKSPQKSPQKAPQKAPTPAVSPVKPIVARPVSPQKPILKTPQKARELTPEDVHMETPVKEEEPSEPVSAAPSVVSNPPQSPQVATPSSAAPTPRGRGRPLKKTTLPGPAEVVKKESSDQQSPSPSPFEEKALSKRQVEESPAPSSSSRAKKARTSQVLPPSSMSTRRRREEPEVEEVKKEVTPAPPPPPAKAKKTTKTVVIHSPVVRDDSPPPLFVPDASKCCSGWCRAEGEGPPAKKTIEIQTDITIRQKVEDISMGERRRSNLPLARKGRKSVAEAINRSNSRNSSASTPARSSATPAPGTSATPATFKSAFAQTYTRPELDKDELIVMRITETKKFVRMVDIGPPKPIIVNEETCREIDAENAEIGDVSYEKRTSKIDGKREVTFIIEAPESITQRLVEEKGYQVVSQSTDLPSMGIHDSPIKRPRRDDRSREEAAQMRQKLLKMYRVISDHEVSNAFKKPVPPEEVEYDQGVYQRIDLSMIRKEIDNGQISDIPTFYLRCYRMISNALMYNGYDHEVHIQAKFIYEKIFYNIDNCLSDDYKIEIPPYPFASGEGVEEEVVSDTEAMDPEPFTPVAPAGTSRGVFFKKTNNDSTMTTEGNRRSKKSTK